MKAAPSAVRPCVHELLQRSATGRSVDIIRGRCPREAGALLRCYYHRKVETGLIR